MPNTHDRPASPVTVLEGSPPRCAPRWRCAAVGGGLLLAALAGPAAGEEQLRESDQKKLGDTIAEYFRAKSEAEGISEALAEVREELDRIGKKLDDADPLSLVEDLEKAVYFANDYDKQRVRVGKGRIDELEIEHPYFGELPVVLHAPKRYSARKGPYPLILTIPDAGQSPEDHLQTDWANGDVFDEAIVVSFHMPSSADAWSQMGSPEEPGGLGLVMASFGSLTKTFAVDMDRVFLCGRGAGVAAALDIASQFPHCFAGVAGRTGDAGEGAVANFANTPTFFSGGGPNCTAFEKAAREAGYDNCTLKPDGTLEDLWSWMQGTRRDPMPRRVVLEPASAQSSTSFWLQTVGFDPGEARVEATVDRDSNTIEIIGSGVASVNLSFNDLLVDLDQPVKVIVNGTTHEDLIPRNFQTMLVQAFRNGDTGRVFTATGSYNLPQTDATQ